MTRAKPSIVVMSHWAWDVHFWQFNKEVGFALAELGHQVLWVDDRLRVRRDGLLAFAMGFPFGRLSRTRGIDRLQPWSISRLRLGTRNRVPLHLIASGVRRSLKKLARRADVMLVYTPEENVVIRRVRPAKVVYWTGDEVILPDEDWTVARADAILALSADTFDDMTARAPDRTYRLPTGVPFQSFVDGADNDSCPAELENTPRPIFGFAGNITDQRIDYRFVTEVAKAHPDGTVVLLGPQEGLCAGLADLPGNVVRIPEQPYSEMPRYLAQFDVGLIPYLRTPFNVRSSPLKVHEYFAVGLPVVGTELSALREYGDLASISNDPAEFAAFAGDAVATRRDATLIARRRAAAQANSVDRIAQTLSDVVGKLFT